MSSVADIIDSKVDDPITRIHAIVKGRVQGVGFRAYTQRHAVFYELTGWVRNRWNGTVELVAEGRKSNVEQFLQMIGRGPFHGTTQDVIVDWIDPTGEFKSFRVRMSE